MDWSRFEKKLEDVVVDRLGQSVEMPCRIIDAKPMVEEALKHINMDNVMREVTERLEHLLAEKIVNKVVTEMGTDIKKLMENENVRGELRYMLRKNTELVLEKINGTKTPSGKA